MILTSLEDVERIMTEAGLRFERSHPEDLLLPDLSILVNTDLDDSGVWLRAVGHQVEHVVTLPIGSGYLLRRIAELRPEWKGRSPAEPVDTDSDEPVDSDGFEQAETWELEQMSDPEPTFTAHDRCDRCNAQACVRAVMRAGDLLFCAHHGREHLPGLSNALEVITATV